VVVATSRRIRRELEAIHGAPLEAAVVKPNAIDTSSFPLRPPRGRDDGAPLVLVCVCRIDPKKGLEYLIEAARLLRDGGVRVEVHILGAPETHTPARLAYDRELRARVARDGLDAVVRFHGQSDRRQVRARLEQCDVFVAPFVELPDGDKDGIPTALLEAMAAGCAIVATTAGSIGEALEDGVDGLLVPQRDAPALAAAIARLDTDRALADRLAARAAARVRQEFDVARTEPLFHHCVVHAVERRRTGAGVRALVT
jgi:glycosyltransferase involved in cell wall biosynthesis